MNEHAAVLLTQAAYSLQRAEQCRETLDIEGTTTTDRHGKITAHPLVKVELEHRQLVARMYSQFGFLDD